MSALLGLDSPINVLGLVVLLASAATAGAAVPGARGSAWTRAVPAGALRRQRLLSAAGLATGFLLLVL